MPYDDPNLKEFDDYYQARSASKRERAENWAVAIGLQKVDGLTPSRYLIDVAKRHIEGDISGAEKAVLGKGGKAAAEKRSEKGGQKKAARKGGQKTVDRLLALIASHPHITQAGMVAAIGITRSTIQKHIANLKAAGRLRRIGPDKGGYWEAVV